VTSGGVTLPSRGFVQAAKEEGPFGSDHHRLCIGGTRREMASSMQTARICAGDTDHIPHGCLRPGKFSTHWHWHGHSQSMPNMPKIVKTCKSEPLLPLEGGSQFPSSSGRHAPTPANIRHPIPHPIPRPLSHSISPPPALLHPICQTCRIRPCPRHFGALHTLQPEHTPHTEPPCGFTPHQRLLHQEWLFPPTKDCPGTRIQLTIETTRTPALTSMHHGP
jgi:hypothetical protein